MRESSTEARRRIALIGSSLLPGGAERVLTTLANAWAEKHDVALITLASSDHDFYHVRPEIRRIGLAATGQSRRLHNAAFANFRRIGLLAHALRSVRADIAISFVTEINVLAIAAARQCGVPVIVSERTDPMQHTSPLRWRLLRRVAYPFAALIVSQTQDVGAWLSRITARERVLVIPNPVSSTVQGMDVPIHSGQINRPCIVAMGRLIPAKGFDLLLRAFARIREAEVDLIIVGDGAERKMLEDLSVKLGIAGRVRFTGNVPDPSMVLRQACIFVLSSRYEGFPNALLEGMACGLPAVAFDCPSGPRDIIRDGIDGILVRAGDVDSMARAMSRLLCDSELRDRMGGAAAEVVHRFSLARVLEMWNHAVRLAIGRQ